MRRSKIVLIAIEGLDCVGKSTFINKFYEAILDSYSSSKSIITFRRLKFPTTNTVMGKFILNLLQQDINTPAARDKLAKAFMYDRKLKFIESWHDFNKTPYTVIVCDRYSLSLPITMGPMYDDPKAAVSRMCKEEKFRFENMEPTINIVLRAPIDVIKDRIKAKENKDSMEKNSNWIKKRYNLLTRILKWTAEFTEVDNIYQIPSHIIDPAYCEQYLYFEKYLIDKLIETIHEKALNKLPLDRDINTKISDDSLAILKRYEEEAGVSNGS